MKKTAHLLVLLIIILSCSPDKESESIVINEEQDKIAVKYSRGSVQKEVGFKIINVERLTKETASGESVDLILVNANLITNHTISFTVYANKTGSNLLYGNHLKFRDGNSGLIGGGSFHAIPDFSFEVLTNDDESFEAVFSGRMRHAANNDNSFIYLTIDEGHVKFDFQAL